MTWHNSEPKPYDREVAAVTGGRLWCRLRVCFAPMFI